MRQLILCILVFCISCKYSVSQDEFKESNLSKAEIDTICNAVEADFKSEILKNKPKPDSMILPSHYRRGSDELAIFVKLAYSTDSIQYYTKNINGKDVLRIGKGKYSEIEEYDHMVKHNFTYDEISEQVYWFIDGCLAKINYTESDTDYNVLPSNYWYYFPTLVHYFGKDANNLISDTILRHYYAGCFNTVNELDIAQSLFEAYKIKLQK